MPVSKSPDDQSGNARSSLHWKNFLRACAAISDGPIARSRFQYQVSLDIVYFNVASRRRASEWPLCRRRFSPRFPCPIGWTGRNTNMNLTKPCLGSGALSLGIGPSLVFGAWFLVFGV